MKDWHPCVAGSNLRNSLSKKKKNLAGFISDPIRNKDTYADTYKSTNTKRERDMEMEMERNVGRESERSDRPVKIDGFDLAAGKHGCEFRIFFFLFRDLSIGIGVWAFGECPLL